ncbi:MAG: hypothetical protein M3O15_15700 [Acidobacteriota bacterium]|nr:hypothetical protein [Acidobacteriota bacterium]
MASRSAKRRPQDYETWLRRSSLASPLPKSMRNLLDLLAGASSIYLRAQMSVVASAGATKSTGTYEYWERDGHYRIRLDSALGYPLSDVAFDGRYRQGEAGVGAVEISPGDDRLTPFPDGPLTLALAPLRLNDPEACLMCQLRLGDLKQVVQWRRERPARAVAAESAIGAGSFDAGALRTGESDAAGHLVSLVGGASRPESGQHWEITLSDFQPIAGSGVAFPMRMKDFLPGRTVEYTIEEIDLSPRFGDEVFDIYSKAGKILYSRVDEQGVWHGRFVRYVPSMSPTACSRPKP